MTRDDRAGRTGWIVGAAVPAGPGDGHADAIAISRLCFDAAMDYLSCGLDLPPDEVFSPQARPTVRALRMSFDAEVTPGDQVECEVHVSERTRRSITLSGQLRRADGVTVARSDVVLVAVDTTRGVSTDVPPHLWAAVDRLEAGRP
jgi:acyl-CoA thioesterase FadM